MDDDVDVDNGDDDDNDIVTICNNDE
jgi:hypothetical protein